MNFKQFISSVSAFAIAASAFASMATTAFAEDPNGKMVASANFDDGSTGDLVLATTNRWAPYSSVDNGWLRIGNETADVMTVPDKYINVGDDAIVTVKFKLGYMKLVKNNNGLNVWYSVSDSQGNKAVSWNFSPYGNRIDENIVGDNTPTQGAMPSSAALFYDNTSDDNAKARAVTYTLVFDFGKKTVTHTTSCNTDGRGEKAVTCVTGLPETIKDIKTLTFGSNYNNESRRCYLDDVEIWTTAEEADTTPRASSVVITGADTVFTGKNAQYTATVKDQFGNDFQEAVTLSLETTPSGITFVDGKLTVGADAGTGTVKIKAVTATSNLTAEKEVTYRPANKYTLKYLSSLDNNVISEMTDVEEGSNVTLNYPHYILKEGVLYSAERSDGDNSAFGKYFENLSDNFEQTVSYTQKQTDTVQYFSEAENISGMTSGNDTARLSFGKGAYASSDTVITNLPAGKYKVTAAARRTAGSGDTVYNLKVGDVTALSIKTLGYWEEHTGDEFTLSEPTDLIVKAAGDSSHLLDYVLIEKTGEAEVAPTTRDEGYTFTSSIEEAKTKNLVIIGQNGEAAESTPVTIPLTDKLSGFSGEGSAILSVLIKDIPDGITIKSISLE